MRRLVLGLVAAALLSAAAVAPLPAQGDKPVATVNGEKISEQSFVELLKARYGPRVLKAMISNLAIRQAAKAAGASVAQDELERRFLATQRTIELRAPVTGENFEFWLAKQGLTREYFLTELYDQMLLERMVEKQVKITDADVATFYQRNRDQLSEPAAVRLGHICVKSEREAVELRAQIVAGKITWEEAAKKYSLDPWTKDEGGDMGFVAMANTDFHKAAFALKNNGDLSQPVASPMGVHLLKRLAYREARTPKFEEVEATIREQLERRELKSLSGQKREEIMKAAKIDSALQLPTEAAPPATPAAAPK